MVKTEHSYVSTSALLFVSVLCKHFLKLLKE